MEFVVDLFPGLGCDIHLVSLLLYYTGGVDFVSDKAKRFCNGVAHSLTPAPPFVGQDLASRLLRLVAFWSL
jgi:hypothetical protein